MNNHLIDKETSLLIVNAYQKINKLKSILNDEPYIKIKQIIDSGTLLNKSLNEALIKESFIGLISNLKAISEYLEIQISNSLSVKALEQNEEISIIYTELLKNINSILIKINEKQ